LGIGARFTVPKNQETPQEHKAPTGFLLVTQSRVMGVVQSNSGLVTDYET